MVGLNLYLTFYDAVLGRLLIAAGQPEQARARLDTALQLARDTGMRFYDAELLRLRAHTHTDPDARRADIAAALDLARRQGATLFELRAALDDFDLRGRTRPRCRSPTPPAASPPTARARNWRQPARSSTEQPRLRSSAARRSRAGNVPPLAWHRTGTTRGSECWSCTASGQ